MVEDQNFHKVKKIIYVLILFFVFASKSYSQNFKLEKLVNLDSPWGSSFINSNEIIITEKSGKIKIVNILSREVQEISHQLNFVVHGQGGLLDIIHKDMLSILKKNNIHPIDSIGKKLDPNLHRQ